MPVYREKPFNRNNFFLRTPYGPKIHTFASSGCGTVAVVQQAAQSLATLERTCVFKMTWFWVDELLHPARDDLDQQNETKRIEYFGHYVSSFATHTC
jgi:hypothetical protein